jgi:hypothetical protein
VELTVVSDPIGEVDVTDVAEVAPRGDEVVRC